MANWFKRTFVHPVTDQFTDWSHHRKMRADNADFTRMVRDNARSDFTAIRDLHYTQARAEMFSGNNAALKSMAEQEVAASMNALKTGESLGAKLGRDGVFKTAGKKIKGIGKTGMIGAGVVAAVAGLGIMASSWRKDRARSSEREAREAQAEPMPQVMSGDMMAQQQQTMMGMQPTPGEHAARVMVGRGMAPQMGPINPGMNVVPEESVAPLGPSRA